VSDPSRSSHLLPDEVVRLKLNPSVTMYVLLLRAFVSVLLIFGLGP
jgi:hypothetical protein